ncbi:hypothetical protein IQ265_01270 [Nodosilinea sp. LEGE 06152]|uniref:hypothetical protein n=1 Tax=Nodosilinea sp. LEGE 06152 TaxID=2777966 RepID=UPI00187ECA91|nr:hypothetical protein [Nodosilinea sp. LEGE 06152]MBE9155477.1 hypothetical protein [Nodosilinea sp. LEGE 06152]
MAQRSSYPVSSHYHRPQQPSPGQPQGASPKPSPQPAPRSAWPAPQAGPRPYPPTAQVNNRAVYGESTPRPQPRQVLVAGGSVLALAALLISPNINQEQAPEAEAFTCIRQEQPKSLVSRDQVKKLLETDLQAPKATVQEFLNAPYCVLSPGKTEAGLPAEREAYPLEFDPQTWLVVLYDGDRYVGYDFRFR